MAPGEHIGGARVLIAPHLAAWVDAAASEVEDFLAARLARLGTATLCLAGGSTPGPLYDRLAARAARLDWARVRFLWGDERCVPPHRPASNYRLARERLLEPLGVEPASAIRMPAELGAVAGAAAYEQTLRALLRHDPPVIDLVLLGMGEDGHTASLFPGASEPPEDTRWVVPAHAPRAPRARISLSLRVLNAARKVIFLVRGGEKAAMVERVLRPGGAPAVPAARVRPTGGELVWVLDRDAAGKLDLRALDPRASAAPGKSTSW